MKNEIILLIIGGGIAIISSILTLVATQIIDRLGKVKIYTKIVYSKLPPNKTWGAFSGQDGIAFQVPLWIEIINTANAAKVIRDFSLMLYKNGEKIAKMTQINKITLGQDEEIMVANEGAYSFVIEPRSVKRYDLHFIIKKSEVSNDFDELKVSFYDLKDKQRLVLLKKVDNCWQMNSRPIDKDWRLLKSKDGI